MAGMKPLLRAVTLCSLLLLSLSACHLTSPPPWHWERAEAGLPRQAIILSVAADPVDPARLWAGYYAPGGLASSFDGGQTWTTGAEGLADNPVFDLLVTAPKEGNLDASKLWAATRDGLRQSLDGGASWQPAAGDLPPMTAFALASDATGRLYVGLDGAGIYAERQNGQGWQSLTPAEPLASAAILSLAVSADGQQLYAGTAGLGLFASRDDGRTWVNTYTDHYVPNVVLKPTHPTLAVASLRDRLVRTHDGGQSWHTLPLPWTDNEIFSLLWLADGTLGAGTGQGRLYHSQDDGDTWLEGGTGLPPTGAVLALAVAGEQSAHRQRFLAGTWTGLYASDDGGQTWAKLAPSLGVPNAHTLLNTESELLLGTRAGLFRWQPGSQSWTPAPNRFPPGGVTSLAVAPSNHQILYAGSAGDGVYRSHDGGESWYRVPSLGVGVPALAVAPTDSEHVYMLALWERVYESQNGGQNWQARWEGLGVTTEAVSLAVDPLEPIVYVGGDTGLYRSRNGQDWQQVAPTLADQSVLALMVQPVPSPTGGGVVLYIGTTRGVYRSLNRGTTVQGSEAELGWGRGLEEVSVTAFLASLDDPRHLYAGTAYAGLYQSLDWGHTWQAIGPAELSEDVVEVMAWGPAGELFVAAASGVWRGVKR